MPKPQSRIGDVFEIKNGDVYRYFQFVALDISQLNSDVIAVFKGVFAERQSPEEVILNPIDFYTHTTVRVGVPEDWQKIGKGAVVEYEDAVFKLVDSTKEDKESWEGPSDHWYVWHIGEDFVEVGPYVNVPHNAELGSVFHPDDTKLRIFEGNYGFTRDYYDIKVGQH